VDHLHESLRRGKQRGDILSLHQYGVEQDMVVRDAAGNLTQYCLDQAFRHRKIYAELPEDCRIPIAITECGRGSGYDGTPQWLPDMIEYDKELPKTPISSRLATSSWAGKSSISEDHRHADRLSCHLWLEPVTDPEPPPTPGTPTQPVSSPGKGVTIIDSQRTTWTLSSARQEADFSFSKMISNMAVA
jgi:hypothetical protein